MDMNENILTWNITNWITVVIMVAVAFFVFGLVAKGFHKSTGGKYSVGAVGGTGSAAPTN
jgi:hypothetical protein